MNEKVQEYCRVLGIDLTDRTRRVEYAFARFAAYYHLRKRGWEYQKIADLFEYKSHSSIFNGINQMKDKLSVNDKLAVGYWDKLVSYDAKRAVERVKQLKEVI